VLGFIPASQRTTIGDLREEIAGWETDYATAHDSEQAVSDAIRRQSHIVLKAYDKYYKNPHRWIQAYYYLGALDGLNYASFPGDPFGGRPRFQWIDFPWGHPSDEQHN
jgi:hypothetical protein